MKSIKVLITGGWCRVSLALIHFLPDNLEIHVGSHYSFSMSFYSSKCNFNYIYSDPESKPKDFIKDLIKYCSANNITHLIPSLEEGFLISKERDLFQSIGVDVKFPNIEQINTLSNKYTFYEYCISNRIPVSPGFYVQSNTDLQNFFDRLDSERFVIKSEYSNGGKGVLDSSTVDRFTIERMFSKNKECGKVLIQEFISGYGLTVEGVWNKKDVTGLNIRKTHRFKIPIGGAAVIISNTKNEQALVIAKKIMEDMNYIGPAQIEFIIDKNNKAWVIEVNPRWWGTLMLNYKLDANYGVYLLDLDIIHYKSDNDCKIEYWGVWWLGLVASIPLHSFKRNVELFKISRQIALKDVFAMDYISSDKIPFIIQFVSYPLMLVQSLVRGTKRLIRLS